MVRELVPQLRYLDNLRVEQDGCHCSGTTGDDWVILQNAIRDCNSSQTATEDSMCFVLFLLLVFSVISYRPDDHQSFNGMLTFVVFLERKKQTAPVLTVEQPHPGNL